VLFSPVNRKPIALGLNGLVRRAVNAGKPASLKFEQLKFEAKALQTVCTIPPQIGFQADIERNAPLQPRA